MVRFALVWMAVSLALAVGCGGGGGSATNPAPPVPVKQWSSSTVLDSNYVPSYLLRDPIYAADAGGNRMVLVLRNDSGGNRLFASYYSATAKTWGTPQPIQTAGTSANFPALAMLDGGQAVAVWRQAGSTTLSLMAANFDPATGWALPRSVAPDVNSYQVASRGGEAVILWRPGGTSGSVLNSCGFSVANGWGNPETLALSSSATVGQFRVAMDTAGNRLAVWEQAVDSLSNSVFASTYVPGHGWGSQVQLNASPVPGTAGYQPRVAMTAGGAAVVTWAQYQGPNFPANPLGTYYTKYSPTAGWSSASLAVPDVIDVLAMNPSGFVLALGQTPNPRLGNATFSLQSSTFSGSTWRALSTLAAPTTTGLNTNPPSLAVDSSGDFILAFLASQPAPSGGFDAWTARFSTTGQSWDLPAKFPGQSSNVDFVQAISLPNGEASALWIPSTSAGSYGVRLSNFQ